MMEKTGFAKYDCGFAGLNAQATADIIRVWEDDVLVYQKDTSGGFIGEAELTGMGEG